MMMNRNMFKQCTKYILLLLIVAIFFIVPNVVVNASSTNSSDVLSDLSKDENFDIIDFPTMTYEYFLNINNDNDNSNNQAMIEVISIAETEENSLCIYTYQPLEAEIHLTASAILMCDKFSQNGKFEKDELKIYDLICVSSSSVFKKYVLKDYEIKFETERYYNLVTIYREFNEVIDDVVSGGESDGSEYGLEVGQQWCVYNKNDEFYYEMNTFETMEINVEFTGNISFSNGLHLSFVPLVSNGHSWFVAFSCEDYIIEHIYNADLSYKKRRVDEFSSMVGSETNYSEWSNDIYVYLEDTQEVEYEGNGILSKKYKWNRIDKGKTYIDKLKEQNVEISTDFYVNVYKDNIWVFAFAETETSQISTTGSVQRQYYDIEDVTIIRIEFMDIHGNIYNLGVVSDRVNPDNKTDGYGGLDLDFSNLFNMFEKLLMLIGILILVVVIAYAFPFIKDLIKIFVSILLLPFELILKIFKKKK